MRLVFDIESDGFLDKLTKIHCIAALNVDDPSQTWSYGPGEINKGIELLSGATELIAHNGQAFDILAIQKLYPFFSTDHLKVTDTLVMSRLMKPAIKDEDAKGVFTRKFDMPRKLFGSHSLEAWGYRLGMLKGDFGKTTDWSAWSPEMQEYCEQDVRVNLALYNALAAEGWPELPIRFEHDINELCVRIGNAGWTFDQKKAGQLYAQLALERAALDEQLQDLFPSWTIDEEFIPKVNNKRLGYVKGEPFIKKREVKFNPNSRKHIERCLRDKYGWKPKEHTPSGDAKVDESVLVQLAYPEAQKLARSFMLTKRLGMLAEGNNAWLKLVDKDGKLRHTINPLGAISGRCSSFGPNLQQVPAIRAAFGKECRELFTVPEGYHLLGVDLSGIELRCLAHYLPDNGAYGRQILEGDIHQVNADAVGITRDQAKTLIYATCYNAGNQRLGEILGKGAKEGKQLRERFYESNPAFPTLLRQVKAAAQRGYLYGLDGRKLHLRSEHGALNMLLQSCAALIAKQWVWLVDQAIKNERLNAEIIAFVHDELQLKIRGNEDERNHIARRCTECAEEAGRHFKIKIPIEAEYKIGRTWADCH